MSRSVAAVSPGKANRRFIYLAVGLGLLGAILVYAAFSRSSGGGGGPADTPVVVAKADIAARTRITASMVEVRLVNADERAALAFTETAAVVGQVTRFPITANEQVLSSKVVSLDASPSGVNPALSFVVPQGKRGIAINVSEVQNAGGLVLPGDYVDVLVVYDVQFQDKPADPTSRQTEPDFFVQTILQNVEVLAVSQGVVDTVPAATPVAGANGASGQAPNTPAVRNTESAPNPSAATVTLALSPDEAQRVYLAESNGTIRLSVRSFGDSQLPQVDYITKLDLMPKNLPNPYIR
jgi:pilus assembly protein CpaB